MGGETPPAELQIVRAVIAVAIGLVFGYWLLLRPVCDQPSVRTLLPEFRALTGIPTLVI